MRRLIQFGDSQNRNPNQTPSPPSSASWSRPGKLFVVDYQVYERRSDDRTLAIPSLTADQQIFGRPPHLLAADRGFWSYANKQATKSAGVKRVCIPTVGELSAEQRVEQHQRWFRRRQRVRAGGEGRISVLSGVIGLARCRYRREATLRLPGRGWLLDRI